MNQEVLIAIISSGAAVTVLNFLFGIFKDLWDRKNGLRAAMRIMLDDRLTWLGEKYLKEGYISSANLKIYEKMHDSYKALGGNGYHDKLIEKLYKLPTEKTDKE